MTITSLWSRTNKICLMSFIRLEDLTERFYKKAPRATSIRPGRRASVFDETNYLASVRHRVQYRATGYGLTHPLAGMRSAQPRGQSRIDDGFGDIGGHHRFPDSLEQDEADFAADNLLVTRHQLPDLVGIECRPPYRKASTDE